MSDYYAYVDKSNAEEENIFLEFHCLPVLTAGDWPTLGSQQFRNILLESKIPVISLGSTQAGLRERLPFQQAGDLESDWYRLRTNTQQRGLPADLFPDENAEANPIFIEELIPLPPETADALNRLTSIDDVEDAEVDVIDTELRHNAGWNPEFIAVYNVGQGNSNAICNDQGSPLLYFDLGGGCYKNKGTYPSTLNFCMTYRPIIILSHWDTDHYESAKRNTAYQNGTWIVPRQRFGPAHQKFFLQLNSAGKALIWPATLGSRSFQWGTIKRCTHPDPKKKNHSGLAMIASLSPVSNTIAEVLLPADAAYTYIPGHGTCDGLVATHHGAEFDALNAPVPGAKGRNAIAYSFGAGNSYGHPRAPAVTAHRHSNRKDTTGGHIALTDGTIPTLPCGSGCNLGIVQNY